jgi:uncharacterized protein involved in outer membrane biogenesis
MPRPKRLLLRLLLLVLVVIAASVVLVPFLPLSPLKNGAERKLSETLGRKVVIDSLRLNLIRGPYLKITGMTVLEDPSFGEGVFLRAEEVEAHIDLTRYLRSREIAIESLIIRSPHVNLVKNAQGGWSWTTLGRQQHEPAILSLLASRTLSGPIGAALSFLTGNLSSAVFKEINIQGASVRLIDRSGSEPPEILYKNITLRAALAPYSGESNGGKDAKGELVIQSEEDGEADLMKATLPFDLRIEDRGASTLSINGSIGPGPLETKNLGVGVLTINGRFQSGTDAPLSGHGRLSASQVFLPTINLSEKVAGALRISHIGDMNPGSGINSLETAFQISDDTVSTTNLRINQLDGLGDATAPSGSFKFESSLVVDYVTTVNLSAEATSRLKSAGTLLGVIATILEMNNRLSVPINVSGDIRQPQIQVDVNRIF